MSKSFKAFNIIQIIFLAILALGCLATTVYFAQSIFKLSFLDSYYQFMYDNCAFLNLGIGGYATMIVALLIGELVDYIMLAVPLLIFIWFLVLFIRIMKPEKYYCKFRVGSFILNLLIALLMIFNICLLFIEIGIENVTSLYSIIVSLLFVIFFVYHLIMNIVGKKQVGEDGYKNVDPNTFFGSNNGASKMGNYGASAGGYVPPAPQKQAPPPPPVRRAPPPPPPRR